MTLAEEILSFLKQLDLPIKLPRGIEAMNPFRISETFSLCKQFYTTYYNDNLPRTVILGINPGRFGGGLTGIPFTDPICLEQVCSIPNQLAKKPELSSEFIYKMIAAFGGPEKFYKQFYFTSVSPLGFVKDGKNLNYYDSDLLSERIRPFMDTCLEAQLSWGLNRKIAYCLGEGDNFKFITKWNAEKKFFDEVIPLPHPRFIMQYKRRQVDKYIDLYLNKLKQS